MRKEDVDKFIQMFQQTYATYGKADQLTGAQLSMYFKVCASKLALEEVAEALTDHINDPDRGRFPPKVADISFQVEKKRNLDGRPGADTAWATVCDSQDERKTVIWTEEIASASAEICPILDSGDRVGARMAFKEYYAALVAAARAASVPVKWMPSLGTDPEQRIRAIEAGIQSGKLDQQKMIADGSYLPRLEGPANQAHATRPMAALERLQQLKKQIAERMESRDASADCRERTKLLKEATQQKVDAAKVAPPTPQNMPPDDDGSSPSSDIVDFE
ncbi:hypothetical protein [Ideonella sp.]|uniref:hypothetical protein n=1 Tax=Ideonella sp. TaxID=1929293 RepID=UPI0037BEABEE